MIQKKSKDLVLIIQNSPEPPRYYKINKKILKSTSYLLSFTLLASISFAFISFSYSNKAVEQIKNEAPQLEIQFAEELKEIKTKLFQAEQLNEELTQKNLTGNSENDPALFFFSQPTGYSNLTGKELIKIENISIQEQNDKVIFKFDLLNNTTNIERHSGYIFITEYSQAGITFYPDPTYLSGSLNIDYSSGESFFISKFKPIVAEFNKKPLQKYAQYKIYVFNRTGSLLTYKVTEKYNFDYGVK